jgi:hypothetical protein
MRYVQIIDNEGFSMPANEIFKFACCDCGLVHQVVIVASRNRKEIGIAMKRDKRATAARRRKRK